MCLGSCSKLKISSFLGICSYGMHIFNFHFCAISSTSFWVGPLWFSALQLSTVCAYDNTLHWTQKLVVQPTKGVVVAFVCDPETQGRVINSVKSPTEYLHHVSSTTSCLLSHGVCPRQYTIRYLSVWVLDEMTWCVPPPPPPPLPIHYMVPLGLGAG